MRFCIRTNNNELVLLEMYLSPIFELSFLIHLPSTIAYVRHGPDCGYGCDHGYRSCR